MAAVACDATTEDRAAMVASNMLVMQEAFALYGAKFEFEKVDDDLYMARVTPPKAPGQLYRVFLYDDNWTFSAVTSSARELFYENVRGTNRKMVASSMQLEAVVRHFIGEAPGAKCIQPDARG